MNERICFSLLLALTGAFSYPRLYKRLAGLERREPGLEMILWLTQCVGFLIAALLIWNENNWIEPGARLWKLVIACLVFAWLELGLRIFFKWVAPHFGPHSPVRKLEASLWEASSTLGMHAWIDPHPLLQFTGIRWITSVGDHGLGFGKIKESDIPKSEGVIRVACLGNSTTGDGYPEDLEDFLNSCGCGTRFEVLNFGLGWWASVHTMLNFVLNVRDFRPDFVVVHENCNDEKYRGFPGLRGDYANAMRPFTFERHKDEWLYRFSLLYRLGIVIVSTKFPRAYYRPIVGVGMNRGKTRNYVREELQLFRRNIETICDLGVTEGIRVVLTTMPFSRILRYTEFDEERFHPHLLSANAILRQMAKEKNLDLVDLERIFIDKECWFADPFHLGREGVELKALEVGKTIFRELDMAPLANRRWKEVECRELAAASPLPVEKRARS
jgi:hypothetical protein